MTIYDIAKEAGVSGSTVSRVINGRPGISESTRRRVEEVLRKYDYSPDEAARGLVSRNSGMIGILVSDIRNLHYTEGAYIIEKKLIAKKRINLIDLRVFVQFGRHGRISVDIPVAEIMVSYGGGRGDRGCDVIGVIFIASLNRKEVNMRETGSGTNIVDSQDIVGSLCAQSFFVLTDVAFAL